MKNMGPRRIISVNWAGLDEDDDDQFFESCNRMSSVVAVDDLASSGSSSDEDEEFDDPRMSFTSAISKEDFRSFSGARASTSSPFGAISQEDYNLWLAEPGSINERRKRLFHGMGFGFSNKHLLRLATAEIQRAVSKKVGANCQVSPVIVENTQCVEASKRNPEPSGTSPLPATVLVRARSDGDIDYPTATKRKEDFFGNTSKQRLTRTASNLLGACARACRYPDSVRASPNVRNTPSPLRNHDKKKGFTKILSGNRFGAIFLIKNLDTGKEFIVNEYDNEGMWNRLSDLQTGKQLTMEEFEKSVGYSPVVKELMRRENVSHGGDRKLSSNSYISKSLRMSKKSGVALLKNIKGVANSMSNRIGDKEREGQQAPVDQNQNQKPGKNATPDPSSEWVRVRHQGKSYKELSALQLCQEIPAHEGSIWTIRFSLDGHYLASAGEDRVIHVWEVQECELMSMKPDEWSWTPLHPSASAINTPDRYENSAPGSSSPAPSEKKKKGKGPQNAKKGIPDYVHVPETVFGLSEKPVCSFKGHLDDVLDLSWSRSQLLLSSSMDKTVRLWDLDTKTCLKLFAHNDYVTCIQFNPIDDRYFISGSLDSKVRIWNIPDRQVVDWSDIHEMVTAVCYTPDGKGAMIGSHKGSVRVYNAEDCKLIQSSTVEISNKKKIYAKKITGFQFSPWNPSEVLITSADSRIRIHDGSEVTHKFRGFRNTSSQIAACFTQDGKHLVCASEDSQVYVWKHQEANHGKTKSVVNVKSFEAFQCKDVSVAITWPGTVRGEPPAMTSQSKRHSKSSTQLPTSSSSGSPPQEERDSHHPGPIAASKSQLPPLPKKANANAKVNSKANANENATERTATPPEEDMAQLSRTESGAGDSFNSAASPSIRHNSESASISSAVNPSTGSWSSSWSWFDGGNSNNVQATAWGMVIVTAGLSGEIRAYQNFGLPLRVGRQANLFGT